MLSVSLGIMGATSILVGKSVGEESKNRAFKYFRAASYITLSLTALMIMIVVLLQD